MKTRKISLALAMMMTALTVASCGETTVTPSADTTASPDTTAEPKELPEIPEDKYTGYEFHILGVPLASGGTNNEIYAETETGDALNDAVYERNRMTEERFDIKIVKVDGNYSELVSTLGKSVLAGENAYDAVLDVTKYVGSAISNQYVYAISDLPYINLEKSWCNKALIEDAAVDGESYFLMGDVNYTWKNYTWALCFNKRLYTENKLEEPYAMVRDGKWTLDVLEKHCKNITKDLNGDSKLDKDDQWGMLSSKTAGFGLVTSTGITTVTKNKDGSLEYILNNEKNVNILSKIRTFISNGEMQLRAEDLTGSSDIWNDIINIFREGRALYRISVMGDIIKLRDMNDDFGIIPLPKYDEAQESYYTTYQSWNGRGYEVPITADPIRTSAILEYMAYASQDTVTRAFYDVTLQGKVTRDDDSSEMLDLMFASMTSDIGITFELGGLRNLIPEMINSGTDSIASTLASKESSIVTEIEKFETAAKGTK